MEMQKECRIEDQYYRGLMFWTPSDDSYTFESSSRMEEMVEKGGGCRNFLIGLTVVIACFVAALFFLSFIASILVTIAVLVAAIVLPNTFRRFAVTNPALQCGDLRGGGFANL